MQIPVAHAVNPAAEAAGVQQVKKQADTKDQVTRKEMARALDPAKKSEATTPAVERREKRRHRGLDIRA